MLTLIELALVLISGLTMAHLTSKEKQKGPFASFISLCIGPAFLLTLMFVAMYLSPTVQHIYTVVICLLAAGKINDYRDNASNQ